MGVSNIESATLRLTRNLAPLRVRKLHLNDITDALRAGFEDWRACGTYAVTFAVVLPMATAFVGAAVAAPYFIPFLLPILSGLALLGPLSTLWFAALSRARERDPAATMEDATAVFDTPRRITLQRLSFIAVVLFLAWIAVAWGIYHVTLGETPSPQPLFLRMFTTAAGWEMVSAGTIIGVGFAFLMLAIGLVSFSLALDRDITTLQAISTSLSAVAHNLTFALVWGALVTAGLVIGMLPGLLGLAVVVPIFGHATWHVYRRTIR
jgi:uncharacterized membrane protein